MSNEPTDIVEYLRRNAVFNYKDTYIAAADEIERLRVERDNLRLEIDRMVDKLTAQRDAARRERDEARRMVCGLDADIMEDQLEYARHRGWDCYPELKEKP